MQKTGTRALNVRGLRAPVLAAVAGACLSVLPASADVVNAPQPVWAADVFGGWVSSYITVRVEPGMKGLFDGLAGAGAVKTGNRALDGELAKWNAAAITPIFDVPFGNPALAAQIGLDRYYKIHVPEGTDTPAMVKAIEGLKFFENVSHDMIGGTAQTIPNDPSFNTLWGMHNTAQSTCAGTGKADADIDAPEAWDLFTGEGNMTVAVIDSGVYNHVDFGDKFLADKAWNTVTNNNNVSDDCQHGTHCAGTVAAVGDNGVGVAGVSWGALIMPIKVLTGCGGNETDCAEGIVYAADNGAHIITMSLRYFSGPEYFQDACTYAFETGLMVIAAAGNDYPSPPQWPASFEHVIAVGATTNQDTIAGFSSQGDVVDLSAPGVDVNSTLGTNNYGCYSGTSMATPHTAGLAALIWSYADSASNEEVEAWLIEGVEDRGAEGWDKAFGWGRINAYNSIQLANPGVSIKVATPPGNLQAPGESISFDVTVKEGKDDYVPNSQLLHYRYDGGDFQNVALVYKEGDTWTATLPATSCGDEPEFYVSVEGVTTGVKTWPKDAPATLLEFSVGELETNYQAITGFNNGLPQGWSADGFWHVSDLCNVGDSCDGGTYAYFGKDANCRFNNGQTKAFGTLKSTLTLPDVPPAGSLSFEYCWTLQTENKPGLDTAKVYIDGVQIHQATESPNSWTSAAVDVTAWAGQTVELSFVFDSKDQYYNNFRGWQVDGLQFGVTDVVCRGDECYGDYNGDGTLDLFDFLAFTNDFNAGEGKANCDNEGGFDLFDFLCFTNAFNAGC
jgi:subtilisin family serine protease